MYKCVPAVYMRQTSYHILIWALYIVINVYSESYIVLFICKMPIDGICIGNMISQAFVEA